MPIRPADQLDLQALYRVRARFGWPRYQSDLSYRVGGKVLSRHVNQGDTLATLETQEYRTACLISALMS